LNGIGLYWDFRVSVTRSEQKNVRQKEFTFRVLEKGDQFINTEGKGKTDPNRAVIEQEEIQNWGKEIHKGESGKWEVGARINGAIKLTRENESRVGESIRRRKGEKAEEEEVEVFAVFYFIEKRKGKICFVYTSTYFMYILFSLHINIL